MEIGTAEHKAQYFQDLLKTMRESIYFGEFQVWTIRQSLDKLWADKKEAEAKLERKEFPSAGDGRKAIDSLNEGIQKFLFEQVKIEDQNKVLENRIIEIGEYVKGWKTE